MSAARPLNPDEPYFSWKVDGDGLTIYSECCADTFSGAEAYALMWDLMKTFGVRAAT